jgi:Phage Tail Collar Domain
MAICWIKNKDAPMYMDLMHKTGAQGHVRQTKGTCSQVEFTDQVMSMWVQYGYWYGNNPTVSNKINFKEENSMIKTVKKMLGMSGDGGEIIGSISTFAGNFAPREFANCDGRLLQVKDYPALFSILGTTYGGDGRTTFALPDLRPFSNDGQPDTGKRHRVDWNEVGMPRQVICINGIYPSRD